MKLEFSEYI